MALPNAQISQAPMGARAASPMNHPQQMNLSAVPAVRNRRKRDKCIVLGSKIAELQEFIMSQFNFCLNDNQEDP